MKPVSFLFLLLNVFAFVACQNSDSSAPTSAPPVSKESGPESPSPTDGNEELPIGGSKDSRALVNLQGQYELTLAQCLKDEVPTSPLHDESSMSIIIDEQQSSAQWKVVSSSKETYWEVSVPLFVKTEKLEATWSEDSKSGYAIYFGCDPKKLQFEDCWSREFYKNPKNSYYAFTLYKKENEKLVTLRCSYKATFMGFNFMGSEPELNKSP